MIDQPTCPHCGSTHARTCAAVYAAGAQTINLKTRGSVGGVGLGRGGLGVGVGLTGGRSRGTAVSLEAQRADRARTQFLSLAQGFSLFVAMAVVLATVHFPHPVVTGFVFAALSAVFVPIATAVHAERANVDYDRRWMCGACGGIWTQ